MVDDVARGERDFCLRHHERLHRLAGVGMRYADDRDLGHSFMRGDRILYLARVDVEPADEDELAQSVDEEEVAVAVGVRDVPGAEPSVGIRTARAVGPVAR